MGFAARCSVTDSLPNERIGRTIVDREPDIPRGLLGMMPADITIATLGDLLYAGRAKTSASEQE